MSIRAIAGGYAPALRYLLRQDGRNSKLLAAKWLPSNARVAGSHRRVSPREVNGCVSSGLLQFDMANTKGETCDCFSQLLSHGSGHPHGPQVARQRTGDTTEMLASAIGSTFRLVFLSVREADNGDGGISLRADGGSRLLVWRNAIAAGPDFPSDVASRIDRDKADGWSITYQKRSSGWATWSARKGDRIIYQRGIPLCGGEAAYFRLEYDRWQTAIFNSRIPRLVKSLRGDGLCN